MDIHVALFDVRTSVACLSKAVVKIIVTSSATQPISRLYQAAKIKSIPGVLYSISNITNETARRTYIFFKSERNIVCLTDLTRAIVHP